MPNYDFIARGLPPIDIASPLMQVEQIRQQRAAQAMQQQRNDLFAAQQKRQDEIFAQEQQDRAARQQQEAAQAQARAELPKLEAALATGQLVPYLRSNQEWSQIADAVEQNPEFADRFVQLAYQQAGVEMPKRPMGDPRVVDLGGGIRAVMQGEEMRGSPIVPPAPERQAELPAGVREKQWFLSLPPEQQQRILELEGRGKSSDPAAQKQAEQAASAEKAWNMYKTGRDELDRSLGEATTFPGAGLLPALTEDAQTADAAYSAMAPILKQLFRVAGEGVFTDKDQALLLGMLPDRNTLPGARKNALENIDRIVRAKLGLPPLEQQSTGPQNGRGGARSGSFKTPGGATVTINN